MMAVDESSERKRFTCLSIARCTAAAVVAALASAVVVVVLTTGRYPESISLSVTHGHIQAAQVLWSSTEIVLDHYGWGPNETLTIYGARKAVDFWVSMNAHIPGTGSHSGKICNITTVHVFDMPNAPSFAGMVNVTTLEIKKDICAKNRSSLSVDRWINITDTLALSYIARTYGGMNEFTAMLEVNISMSMSHSSRLPEPTIHYCWPVTIGHSRSTTAAAAVACKPSHHINYAAHAKVLAPPPPPPTPPPPPPPRHSRCGVLQACKRPPLGQRSPASNSGSSAPAVLST